MKQQLDRRSERAREEAEAARARIMATLAEIRHRIDPRTVATETAQGVLDRVNHVLSEASSTAKSKPWLLAIGATLAGIALSYRKGKPANREIEPRPKQPIEP